MKYINDKRTVMTLDAGGTNFVFSAIQGNKPIVDEIRLPANADDLEKSLADIVEGFNKVKAELTEEPVAISFAFPGPADYPNGIIGDLGNLPGYRGGVALGPMLEEIFSLPVFINNDGDLYAYGESIAGFLPDVNKMLEEVGSPKRYKNLIGLTLGTGFGAGIVRNGELFTGDNSMAGEIWLLRDKLMPSANIEEHASIRAVQRLFKEYSGEEIELSPKDIFDIANSNIEGNKDAAVKAFAEVASAVGDAISNAVTLIDGLVVIGGGLSGAAPVFMPYLVDEMNSNFTSSNGDEFRRLTAQVYNLENADAQKQFVKRKVKEIKVPNSEKTIKYDPESRIGIGISKLGTSKAISIGAYAFALNQLDK